MAISTSEAILGRLGAGPSYADLQSPNNTISQAVSETPNLGVGPFSNLTDSLTSGINSASKSVSDFFTAPEVGAVSNTLGKIGSVASFFTTFGYALSGIAGLSEFSDLNESLDDIYGVPEDQQLGIMDALYAALPGPTLQGQYAKALDEYNQSRPSIRGFNNPKDSFNTSFGSVGTAGRVGDPALGSDVSSDMGDDSDLGGYGGFSDDDGSTI